MNNNKNRQTFNMKGKTSKGLAKNKGMRADEERKWGKKRKKKNNNKKSKKNKIRRRKTRRGRRNRRDNKKKDFEGRGFGKEKR